MKAASEISGVRPRKRSSRWVMSIFDDCEGFGIGRRACQPVKGTGRSEAEMAKQCLLSVGWKALILIATSEARFRLDDLKFREVLIVDDADWNAVAIDH